MIQKKAIKPIEGTQKIFKIFKKQVVTGTSKKNKSGKTYKLVEDLDGTKLHYQNLIDSIPSQPGIIILTGFNANSQKIIEIITSNECIKTKFARPQDFNRYQKLLNYLKTKNYNRIQIQLAHAS